MGFFDRLVGKKPSPASPTPASAPPTQATPAPAAPPAADAKRATPEPASGPTGGLLPQLTAARERLEAKDLPGALALYEQILATAGDRPDVLVTISGDLGTCGYVETIIELIAPRYDAERHGPATGLNLLQAYLATRNPGAAQHVLDILFALQRPELEERLWGFSNAIAELLEAQRRGELTAGNAAPKGAASVSLVSISKPIWAYGVEDLPGLLPSKEGRVRRVAFGQVAHPGLAQLAERMAKPEDDLGRFARGLPLWFAETFSFCPLYAPIAAVGLLGKEHYALFPAEWTSQNIRQLVETSSEGIDYIFTSTLVESSGDTELVMKVWEVKKFRERKTFSVRWTPSTADAELTKLHEQVRLFMEWCGYPEGAGLPYVAPARPTAWIQTLGASLSLFLTDKGVLPKEQLVLPASVIDTAAEHAAANAAASIAWLTLRERAQRLGVSGALPEIQLSPNPLVGAARGRLGL